MATKTIQLARDEVASHVRKYAEISNEIDKLDAMKNAETLEISQKYEEKIEEQRKALRDEHKVIEAWSNDNPDEFPADKKSLEFPCGIIGHRKGTPTVATIGGWTIGRALKVIISRGAKQFVTVKESLSKDSILDAVRNNEVSQDWLREVGLQVVQSEKFFIDPKLEETDKTV